MINKRKTIIIGSIATAATAGAISGIAIGIHNASKNRKVYDFGIVIAPVNSLNYVKYASSRNVVAATIPPLITRRPNKESDAASHIFKNAMNYYERINMPDLTTFRDKVQDVINASNVNSTSFDSYYMKNYYNETTKKSTNLRIVSPEAEGVSAGIKGYMGFIDRNMKWNDGTSVSASNFIDYINLILDLNSYSSLLPEVEAFGLAGATNFVDAQKAYFRKYKTLYKTPLGIKKNAIGQPTVLEFPSQEPGDDADVAVIKKAYLNIGMFGDEYSSRPSNTYDKADEMTKGITKTEDIVNSGNDSGKENTMADFLRVEKAVYKAAVKSENSGDEAKATALSNDSVLFIQYERLQTQIEGIYKLTTNNLLMPINPNYMKRVGVAELGKDINDMPYVGAYKFDGGSLGANGYLSIAKNDNFIYKDDVFTNHIKFYFSTNENVNYAMYKDGYIGKTSITPIKVSELFSDLKERDNIQKPFDTSTEGFAFNLDTTSRNVDPKHDPIQYASFRKAIFYAIDREQILKIAQQDSSLVKSNFSDLIGVTDELGNYMSSILTLDELAAGDGTHMPTVPGFTPSGPIEEIYKVGSAIEPTVNAHIQPLEGDSTEIITKQYDLQSRYSIDTLFESADRKDRVVNRELARKIFEQFKQEWKANTGSDFSTYSIQYVYPSEAKGESIGISMQNQLKETFGGAITLKMKGFSQQIFDEYKMQGNFDIYYGRMSGKNYPSDALDPSIFISKLLIEDNVADGDSFLNNPTGGWTFDDIIKKIVDDSTYKAEIIRRLHMHEEDLNVIIELLKLTSYEENLKTTISETRAEKERVSRIKAFLLGKEYIQGATDQTKEILTAHPTYKIMAKRANMLAQFDKLILEDAPVIPVTIGGQGWEANRMWGSMTQGTSFQLEYTFDKNNIPRDDLKKLV